MWQRRVPRHRGQVPLELLCPRLRPWHAFRPHCSGTLLLGLLSCVLCPPAPWSVDCPRPTLSFLWTISSPPTVSTAPCKRPIPHFYLYLRPLWWLSESYIHPSERVLHVDIQRYFELSVSRKSHVPFPLVTSCSSWNLRLGWRYR